MLFGDRDEFVDNAPERILVANRRLLPACDLAAPFRRRLVAAMFARKQASRDRAPDEDSELLIERDGKEFVFGFARLERVVNLLRHEGYAAIATRDLHRLHHVPARPVGTADVAHLARAHETVERL